MQISYGFFQGPKVDHFDAPLLKNEVMKEAHKNPTYFTNQNYFLLHEMFMSILLQEWGWSVKIVKLIDTRHS